MRSFFIALAALAVSGFSAMAAPPLRAYGDLPGLELASLSPSGDRYAVVGTLGEARKLAFVSADGKPLMVADIGEAKMWGIEWAGEDKVVVLGSGTYALGPNFGVSKYEIGHATVVDLSDKSVRPLMTKGAAGNGVWGEYGVYQEKGRWVGYFGGITLAKSKGDVYFFEKGQPDLYRVDLTTGSHGVKARGPSSEGAERDWLVGPQGVVATLDFDNRSGDWRLKAGESGKQLAVGVDKLGDVSLISLGRTADTIIYRVAGTDADERVWVEQSVHGGPAVEFLPDEPITGLIHDRKTRLLVGYVRDANVRKAVFFDPARQASVDAALKQFEGLNPSLRSWNEAFDRVMVHTSGPADSGSWWLVDLASGKADRVGHSYPMVKPEAVGPMTMVAWTASDGLKMEGVLTVPPGVEARNLPLVVLPHGGPAWRDYAEFDWWTQAFASGGYAVFQPNFRGSTGYGDAFRHAGDGQWGRRMQTDISEGVAELARQGIVDPKRACIVGASYGGYAALAGVTIQQGLYRCAVSVSGVSDLKDMLDYVRNKSGQSSAARRSWLRVIGEGDLDAVSPRQLIDRIEAPVLLIHGKDDTVVPYSQSQGLYWRAKVAGKPVELVTLKGEDHWLSRGDTRLQMLEAAVHFVEKHNPVD